LRLGYRKSYCRLGLYLIRPVRSLLILARIFRKMYKLILPSRHCAVLDGLLLAQDIARATERKTAYNNEGLKNEYRNTYPSSGTFNHSLQLRRS
jgi:hypothetical protein